MNDRRQFMKKLLVGGGLVILAPELLRGQPSTETFGNLLSPDPATDAWEQVPGILRRIKPPVFRKRDLSVLGFGAVGDGKTDCTEAFRKAIAASNKAGGGRVVVPPGEFLTGAIHLQSNVNLHVSEGATIKFSSDPAKYMPLVFTRFEGTECMNFSPFIYAFEQENIAITGTGVLDGSASAANWWAWTRRPATGEAPARASIRKLLDYSERGVPVSERVFGLGHFLRPNFIQPYRSRNVLIEGVRIINSPMWEIHPVLCTNVTVKDVKIVSHGPNNDGCDPESCTDVLITGCLFDTGDDCIAIKSGRNADGRRLNAPSQNIIIQNCEMKDGHGGVTIGSEISGGVCNVFAQKCKMDSPNLDRALRLKNNAMRGGLLEHIYMRDVEVGQVGEAIVAIDFYYEEADKGAFVPVVRNVNVRNVTSKKSKYALYLRGFKNAPIADIVIEDCSFDNVAKENLLENVHDLTLRNVRINGRVV
jgi:polygalacturonase